MPEPRQGYGNALRRGLAEAQGEYVVLAEPDGTFMGKDILKLLAYADDFDLVLGTQDNAALRPQNPFASFVVKERDEVFVFDQRFELEKKRVVRGGHRGPVRIGGNGK